MKKTYHIIVDHSEVAEGKAYGIYFPDIPGCFSAADSYEDILDNARESALLHLGELDEIPEPANLDGLTKFDAAKFFAPHIEELGLTDCFTWGVDVDLSKLAGPAKRINITIPEYTLAKIDAAASAAGKSRSEFLAESALKAS